MHNAEVKQKRIVHTKIFYLTKQLKIPSIISSKRSKSNSMVMTRMMNYIFSKVNTVGTLFQYLETKLPQQSFCPFRTKYCII